MQNVKSVRMENKVVDTIIAQDLKALGNAVELRQRNLVKVHLDVWLQNVKDLSSQIEVAIENCTTITCLTRKLCNLLSTEIVDSTQGNMTVREYVQKSMAKQGIYIFVGTHWIPIRTQVYYDFVKDAARQSGLSVDYVESPEFMCKLFEQVAFSFARDRETFVPRDAVWINLQNGTLEIADGQVTLRDHVREDFFTYVLPYSYDPGASCPRWDAFLKQVLPEYEERLLLGEYIGYCLTMNMKLEKMAILYGTGANGKSVCTDVITELLGRSNVSHVDLEKLTTDDNHRMQIEGKLANISQENGPNVQYSTLKNMVSGEPVMVKSLYKDVRMTSNYGKLIASYNTLPKSENTLGFFRRWLLFKFGVTIPEKERDIHLKEKLCKELPGILNWVLICLRGLIERGGFTDSQACKEALNDYRVSTNSVLVYLDERLILVDDGRISVKDLYSDYINFCRVENFKNTFGRNNFLQQLYAAGVGKKVTNGVRYLCVKYKSEL